MKTSKEFVADLEKKFETLYQVSEAVTRDYFASNPSKEHLMDHFKLRMMNERWNMVEFAKKVAALPVDTSGEEAMLLCKQTFDEANHYRMVREVLEHLNGGPISMDHADASHGKKDRAKGVTLIDRYEAQGSCSKDQENEHTKSTNQTHGLKCNVVFYRLLFYFNQSINNVGLKTPFIKLRIGIKLGIMTSDSKQKSPDFIGREWT